MFAEFHTLEESLKTFLTESQSDSYNSSNANFYKYHNLKIYMDPKKSRTPHFIIRIGISEAMYNLEKGEKISGGLGTDERLIRRWLDRNLSKFNLNFLWNRSTKVKPVTMKEDIEEDY